MPTRRTSAAVVLALITAVGTVAPAAAQEAGRALTADDYARAESFLSRTVNPLVHRAGVRATWLPDERFWYRVNTPAGAEFVLVDPATGDRAPAFDHARLAYGLSAATGAAYEAGSLPFRSFEYGYDGGTIFVSAEDEVWACDLMSYRCSADRRPDDTTPTRNEILSPDGRQVAFIRDHNLWVRELSTGEERPTTRDGILDYGYATDNAGWKP